MKSPIQKLAEMISDKDPAPNKLTLAMGTLVRRAREEARLNQGQLAQKVYRRQATISAIETGTSEVSRAKNFGTTCRGSPEKPISYFSRRMPSSR